MQWLSLDTGLLAVHVLANVVWIGALLAVVVVGSRAPFMADSAEVGALARRVHVRLAVPAFAASFGAGLARLGLHPRLYAHLPWLHAKLSFAVVVIVLHHVIGARVKRIAGGHPRAREAGRSLPVLGGLVFVAASAAVVLAVAKSLP